MRVDEIAKIAHDNNRAYCTAIGDMVPAEWKDLTAEAKHGMVQGVMHVIKAPDNTPESQHEAWLASKVENGWRYGPVKSEVDRTHPNMVPYNELPPNQRAKDHLFRATVKSLIPHLVDFPRVRPAARDDRNALLVHGDRLIECRVSELRMGDQFCLKSQPGLFMATSDPQINYGDYAEPVFSINAEVVKAAPQAEMPEGSEIVPASETPQPVGEAVMEQLAPSEDVEGAAVEEAEAIEPQAEAIDMVEAEALPADFDPNVKS